MSFLNSFLVVAHMAFYIGALLATGTVFYGVLFATDTPRIHVNRFYVIGLFAIIALIAVFAGYALTSAELVGDISGAVDPDMLALLWQTPVGTTLAYRVLGLLLILFGVLLRKMSQLSQGLMLFGCLAVLGSFINMGHVAAIPNFLFRVLLLIHLLGIAIWVGVLFPLYRLSADPMQIKLAAKVAHKFGRLAMYFVPVLLIAGGLIAYRLVGSLTHLLTTGYGQVLLVKVLIVSGLLGLAAINKLRLVPALQVGSAHAQKQLKFTVAMEIVFVVMTLSITALLTSALTLPEINS